MRFVLAVVALALAAACDKGPDNTPAPRADTPTPPQASSGSSTPTTPANAGAPRTQEEKKEGANPVQGQVDPKQAEQHRDFKQPGDAKGPTSPETAPKRGG